MTNKSTCLADLVDEVDERNPLDGVEVFSVSEVRGIVPQSELFTKPIATKDRSKYRRIQYGDVIFNPYLLWNGAVGVCFHKNGGCVSPAYPVLRPKHPDTARFLHYFFRSEKLTLAVDAIATGSVTRRRTAPLNDVLNLRFALPSVPAQQTANRLLQVLDDKITMCQRMNETLEAMARALFQSWFVDFDPVRTKLDGHKPIGMDETIAAYFPSSFAKEGDNLIPDGWRIEPLNRVYDIRSGLSKPRSDFGFGHGFLTFMDVMNNTFVPKTLTALVNSTGPDQQLCSILRGDVFLTRTSETIDELGMSCVAMDDYPQATFNGFTKRLRAKAELSLDPEYAGYYFRSPKFRRDVTAMSSLSTRASLNNEMLAKLTILIPPKPIVNQFSMHVRSMVGKMQANNRESETLATLRDALLPKLLSGAVRMKAENK